MGGHEQDPTIKLNALVFAWFHMLVFILQNSHSIVICDPSVLSSALHVNERPPTHLDLFSILPLAHVGTLARYIFPR